MELKFASSGWPPMNFPSEKRTGNLHKKLICSLKVEIGLPLFDL
jgi:hypothetical protein